MNLEREYKQKMEMVVKGEESWEKDENDPTYAGKWTEGENIKYVVFMDYHKNIFISKEKRKSIRIFKHLSQFLKTRTPQQCRSHFQKLIKKYQTISKIRTNVRNESGKHLYDQIFEDYAQSVDNSKFNIKTQLFSQDYPSTSFREVGVQTDIVGFHWEKMELESMKKSQQASQQIIPFIVFQVPNLRQFQSVR